MYTFFVNPIISNQIIIITYNQPFFAKRVFHIFDKDGSNTISRAEFREGLEQFYCRSEEEKVQCLFQIYDQNGNTRDSTDKGDGAPNCKSRHETFYLSPFNDRFPVCAWRGLPRRGEKGGDTVPLSLSLIGRKSVIKWHPKSVVAAH